MTKDIVIELVFSKEISFDVAIECKPIVRQLFWAKYEYTAIT
jgi:hypothetical protein